MLRLVPIVCGWLLVLYAASLWMDSVSNPGVWRPPNPLQNGWHAELAEVGAHTALVEIFDNPSTGIGPAIEPNGLV